MMEKKNKISDLTLKRLRCMSNPKALKMLVFLATRENARVIDIASYLKCPNAHFYSILKQLVKAGIVNYEFKNHLSLYSLNKATIVEAIDEVKKKFKSRV